MDNLLARKLDGFVSLSRADATAIEVLCGDQRSLSGLEDLIQEGDEPDRVFVLLEGWGFRYKLLPDGQRQILAFLVPGDLCDIHIFILSRMDHGIGLLGPARVAVIKPDAMLEIMKLHRTVERALWWSTLVDEAILREWLVNLAKRDAYEATAHLLYELFLRMRAVGLVQEERQFSLPLTQVQIGDAIGLTPVAINRALQRLRSDGVITFEQKKLTVHEAGRLAAISSFAADYLHLGRAAGKRISSQPDT